MTYDSRQTHENLLDFLEDNISKLVKLKVASRAKYKEYDEHYMDYLTAESIEDEERMELYEDLTENAYAWLRHKLTTAIKANEELSDNPLVREYLRLMFATYDELDSSDDEELTDADKDIDVSYTHLFEGEDSFYISNFVCYFSKNLSEEEEEELEDKEPKELLKLLEDRVFNHVEEWIDDLPHNDLKILKELVKNGRTEAPVTYQDTIVEKLALIDKTIDPEHPEFIIYDDVRNAVAPYLDAALEKKEKNNEGFLECLLQGLLNIVGRIEEDKAREVIKSLLPQTHIKIVPEEVDRFFDHSMIVKYCRGGYVCQPDGDLWSHLADVTEWEEEIRENVDPFYPTDIADVIAHGEYPYFKPHRIAEQAFFSLFVGTFNYEPIDALGCLTYYYSRLQEPDYTVKEMLHEVAEENMFGSLKQANFILDILTRFSNGIPKFILKGNASSDVYGTSNKSYRDVVMPAYTDESSTTTPYTAVKKIGRNDPCPCGSGKKYKKCCGQGS